MEKEYLICGPYRLDDANARTNALCLGIVPPTAIAGLTHKLERDLRTISSPIRITGGNTVIHEWSLLGGHPKHSNETGTAPVIESQLVRGLITIILEIAPRDTDDEFIDIPDDTIETSIKLIEKKLTGGWLSGGRLFPMNATTNRATTTKELLDQIGERRGGWVLTDAEERLIELVTSQPGIDGLDVLLDAVTLDPETPVELPEEEVEETEGDNEQDVETEAATQESESQDEPEEKSEKEPSKDVRKRKKYRLGRGFVPIAVGFVGIEEPKARLSQRATPDETLHVYAEGLSSLGQYVWSSNLGSNDGEAFERAIWRYDPNVSKGIYRITALS